MTIATTRSEQPAHTFAPRLRPRQPDLEARLRDRHRARAPLAYGPREGASPTRHGDRAREGALRPRAGHAGGELLRGRASEDHAQQRANSRVNSRVAE